MMYRHTFALALLTATLGATAFAQQPKTTFTVVVPAPIVGKNYNPFSSGSQHLWPTLSAIYESLFYVNTLDGKVNNVLGTGYTWSKDNKTLTVTTRSGVKWTDGKPFSAADVAFTFNYMKQYPELDLSGVWKNGLVSVKASSPNTLTFSFDRANTPIFLYLAHTSIVPEHLWSGVKDPATYTNEQPVGTGPFVAETYSQQAVRVLKNPNYWIKGEPHVDAVVWLGTNGNDAALLKMLKGEADFSFLSIPDPKAGYKDKGPNYDYWYPATGVNALYFNTLKAPFNDPAFRRAVAGAIDTKNVTLKAYSGSAPVADPTAIVPSQLAEWKPSGVAPLAPKYDPAAADKALTSAGYKTNAQGQRLGKDGKPLPTFKILVGSGWTDFITMAQIVGDNLKKVGINTTIDQQVYASYAGSLQSATYDMGVSWGWGGGPTPYNLYYQSFAPQFSAPVGKTASSNIAHFTDPAVTKALLAYSGTSDPAGQKQAVATMVAAVLKAQPWVPLTARTAFDVFNTSRFTGFPSAQNPYNNGDPSESISGRSLLLNVRPK